MTRIDLIEQGFAKKEVPAFDVGDTVDVHVLIKEGDKERVQVYGGTVIRRRGIGMSATYTVRRIVQGQGVERTFQTYSPLIASIEVKRRGDVRRSKLYHLRTRTGKAARIRERLESDRGESEAAPAQPD